MGGTFNRVNRIVVVAELVQAGTYLKPELTSVHLHTLSFNIVVLISPSQYKRPIRSLPFTTMLLSVYKPRGNPPRRDC